MKYQAKRIEAHRVQKTMFKRSKKSREFYMVKKGKLR